MTEAIVTGVLSRFSMYGRNALVTGGGSGIGLAIAAALIESGALVTIAGRSIGRLETAQSSLAEVGLAAETVQMDVLDLNSIREAFETVQSRAGIVDCLINNAGISIGVTAIESDEETYRKIMGTNLDGAWRASNEFARRLIEAQAPKGSIVNVGSISAYIVNRPRWQAPYLMSKAAIHRMTEAHAAEWAEHSIRVNAIAPGYVLTEMSPVDEEQYYETCVAPAAMKRYATPDEMAPVALLLASDASSFMTGSVVTADGGFVLY